MNDTKISLCLTYPNYKNPDYHILFRVADYYPDDDKLLAVPFYEEAYGETPKRIGANPKDIYPGMTALREWEYNTEDPGRTLSYSYDGSIYEIIFPEELREVPYSDTNKIRRILCEGFSMDDNISDNILIAIGKSGSHNAVLLCRKRNLKKVRDGIFVVSSNTHDMLHSVHYLEEYDIVDTDIVDSSACHISLPNGDKAPVRYFYNSTVLPNRIGIFHPIAFSKYVPTFVSNYIKKNKSILQFSLNDIRRITDMMEVIFNDHEYISDFFAITGFTDAQLQDLLPKYKQIIFESLLGDATIDSILQRCLVQDPAMHERFVELVKAAWLEEKSQEKQQILDELSELKKTYAECESDLLSKKEQRDAISTEISSIKNVIASKKEELSKIQADIETELKEFADNIVHSTALCAVAQSAIGNESGKQKAIDLFTIETGASGDKEQINDYDDFQEALADNLITIGYDDTVADAMAQLIFYSISARLPILVTSNEDEIAKCIAAMYSTDVSVVNIGSGMNAVDYIPVVEKKNDNMVILVNGAFSSFSLEHFNAIRYHFANAGYVVLFALDGADTSLIPKTVYEKAMFLDSSYGYGFPTVEELTCYSVNYSIFIKTYSEEDLCKQKKKLNPFIDSGIISTVAASKYASFMVDIECDIHKDWLLLLQLCVQAKANYKTEQMRGWLSDNGIDIDILNNYLCGDM